MVEIRINARLLLVTVSQFDITLFKSSKVSGCRLVRQADLPFDFKGGACNTIRQSEEKTLLCFDYDGSKNCYT